MPAMTDSIRLPIRIRHWPRLEQGLDSAHIARRAGILSEPVSRPKDLLPHLLPRSAGLAPDASAEEFSDGENQPGQGIDREHHQQGRQHIKDEAKMNESNR